jgi:hypothetical protein
LLQKECQITSDLVLLSQIHKAWTPINRINQYIAKIEIIAPNSKEIKYHHK